MNASDIKPGVIYTLGEDVGHFVFPSDETPFQLLEHRVETLEFQVKQLAAALNLIDIAGNK